MTNNTVYMVNVLQLKVVVQLYCTFSTLEKKIYLKAEQDEI